MHSYPATPDSVRVGPSQQQFLTPQQKGRIMRHVAATYDPETQALVRWLLFDHAWQNGVCDPALATIAKGTRIGLTTVKNRLKLLAADGTLSWVRRGLALGKRFVQWTNAYLFKVPAEPTPEPAAEPVCCEAVRRPPITNEEIREARRKPAAAPVSVPVPAKEGDLLLARRLAFQAAASRGAAAGHAVGGATHPPPSPRAPLPPAPWGRGWTEKA